MFVSARGGVLERVLRQSSESQKCLWLANYARLAIAGMAQIFEFDLCVRAEEEPEGVPLTFVALWDRRGALSVAFALLPPCGGPNASFDSMASAGRETVVDDFLGSLSASLENGQPFVFALLLDTFLPRLARSWSWTEADIYPCVERRLCPTAVETWPADPVPTLDTSGRRVRVGTLTAAAAPAVWAHWPYRAERPVSAIALLLERLRSAAVFVDDEPGTLCASVHGLLGPLSSPVGLRYRGQRSRGASPCICVSVSVWLLVCLRAAHAARRPCVSWAV
jgi:hypothetical protein